MGWNGVSPPSTRLVGQPSIGHQLVSVGSIRIKMCCTCEINMGSSSSTSSSSACHSLVGLPWDSCNPELSRSVWRAAFEQIDKSGYRTPHKVKINAPDQSHSQIVRHFKMGSAACVVMMNGFWLTDLKSSQPPIHHSQCTLQLIHHFCPISSAVSNVTPTCSPYPLDWGSFVPLLLLPASQLLRYSATTAWEFVLFSRCWMAQFMGGKGDP